MENLKRIIQRIKKNPETLHIKSLRFLKKKYYQLQAKKSETATPMSNEEFKRKTGFKGKENINEKLLFTNKEIIDKKSLERAEKIFQGRYELLGREYLLKEINWHKDFNSGKVWEKKHFSTLEYDTEGDKKVPWELSKCQHFVTLGLAYRQTKEKKYFEEYKKQLLNWIGENPYEIGINWVTPMECAIRAINWIQAYQLCKEEYTEELTIELSKQLYLHGKFIRKNMEWSPAKENHYLSNCMGLFFIGTFFKNGKETQSWKEFAHKELEKEIRNQVSEDGVDYEGSLNYHRLVTEILLLTYILAERNEIAFSQTFKKRLENMHEFIMYYTSPSGKAPAFGDTDNGRILHIWHEDTNDHRDLLSVAAVFFKRPDFKANGKYHERIQLLIDKEEYTKIEIQDKELQSKAFTDYYIMRDRNLFLMIHCGDIGRKGFGGHGHNDQLSFVFSTKNKDYIIHPGTYCYTSDKKIRHELRSTAYHNTLLVNNQEQNKIKEETPFDMENNTKAFCFQWQADKTQDIFIGKHLGYKPNIITREIHYDKMKKEIVITDRLKEEAELELNLYFYPEINIEQKGKKVFLNKEICIECELEPVISTTIYSREYGHLSQTKRLTIKKKGNALLTRIYPIERKEEALIKIIYEEKITPKEEKQKRVRKSITKKEQSPEEEYY